jgi:ubiquinone/menaquinone biosynthesis C-methylase UbiE
MAEAPDSKERFSNRVADYVLYRPGYPRGVLDLLRDECGLTPESVIADIGSGTGILTRLFLENGNFVYGIEPNAAMREAGEEFLAAYVKFRSVAATAEATTLPDVGVDLVTAAQAYHWFDPPTARAEFARILRPGAWVAVIWNERKKDLGLFAEQYEQLLRTYGTDYARISETYPESRRMSELFGSGGFRHRPFSNRQMMDSAALRGRLLSSSYAPVAGHPNHEPMLADLRKIFDSHAVSGRVRFEYETHVYYGRMK